MKPLTAVVLVILTVALLLHDVDARGGGGGPSGRGSIGSGSSKSRITKTTPIKPVRFRSAVIKSQAISGSRTKLFVENTDCTQVEKQINGTMIVLYEFNPNAENDYTGIIIMVIIAVIIVVNGGPRLCITLLDRCC